MRKAEQKTDTGFAKDEKGSELVEFAIASAVLLMLIFGIMDTSRALYAYHFVSGAAREATRYAMVRGSTWSTTTCTSTATFSCNATSANVTTYVKGLATSGIDPNNLTVTTSWPGTTTSGAACSAANGNNSPGCEVSVQVNYVFGFVLPFLPKNALTLTSTSSVPITQ